MFEIMSNQNIRINAGDTASFEVELTDGSCEQNIRKFIGVSVKSNCNKRFDSIEEAFMFYKNEKENYIKFLANKYYEKKLITQKVYDTLMNYKVEITD